MRRIRTTIGLATLAIVAAAAVRPAAVRACGNQVEIDLGQRTRDLVAAERLLRKGREVLAAQQAASLRHLLETMRPESPGKKRNMARLAKRADYLVAVAVIRRAGALHPESGRTVPSIEDTERERHLEQALEVIDARAEVDPSPIVRAHRAEALARLGRDDEARHILERLAESDVVPDAHAYATLARLRTEAGQVDAAKEAAARCRGMVASGGRDVCPAPRTS